MRFKKNAKNLCFWAFWVKMGQIEPKRGHFRIFGEKVKNSPSFPILFYFSKQKKLKFHCAISEKNWRTEIDRETDRQRRVTVYRSESARWASDQKLVNSKELIVRKMQKTSIFGNFGSKLEFK